MQERKKPSEEELGKLVAEMEKRLDLLEQRYEYARSAFPTNDLGKPDYDGHRRIHNELSDQSKIVQGYKVDVTRTIFNYIVVGLLALLVLGFFVAIGK